MTTSAKLSPIKISPGSSPWTVASKVTASPRDFGVTKTRKDVDWGRKIFHATGGSLIGGLYLGLDLSRDSALLILGAVAVPFMIIDALRLWMPSLNQAAHSVFGKIMRKEESNKISTASWLFVSAWLSVFFFSREVAALAAVFVAFADPAASYFGVRFGKARLPWGKSLEGTLGSFATAAVAGMVFCGIFGLGSLLPVAFAGALAAAIAETLPLKGIDDNFTIPLGAGLMMHFSSAALASSPALA